MKKIMKSILCSLLIAAFMTTTITSLASTTTSITVPDTPYTSGNYYLMRGDINGDSLINSTDLLLLKKMVLEVTTSFDNPEGQWAADLNSDGKINSSDLLILKQIVLGVKNGVPKTGSFDRLTMNQGGTNYIFSDNPEEITDEAHFKTSASGASLITTKITSGISYDTYLYHINKSKKYDLTFGVLIYNPNTSSAVVEKYNNSIEENSTAKRDDGAFVCPQYSGFDSTLCALVEQRYQKSQSKSQITIEGGKSKILISKNVPRQKLISSDPDSYMSYLVNGRVLFKQITSGLEKQLQCKVFFIKTPADASLLDDQAGSLPFIPDLNEPANSIPAITGGSCVAVYNFNTLSTTYDYNANTNHSFVLPGPNGANYNELGTKENNNFVYAPYLNCTKINPKTDPPKPFDYQIEEGNYGKVYTIRFLNCNGKELIISPNWHGIISFEPYKKWQTYTFNIGGVWKMADIYKNASLRLTTINSNDFTLKFILPGSNCADIKWELR